jgi:alanyl-tRNA synthetase
MPLSNNISSQELRELFIKFFKEKGHRLVSPSSLAPDDPSVLFTTAGMQQFKGFYLKPEKAPSPRIVTIQPSFRTTDIEEVGDRTHLTLFEMLGNFSFGYTAASDNEQAYFKEQAIKWAWEFLTSRQWLGIPYERISATYFHGDQHISKDEASKAVLEFIGGCSKITPSTREDNFWGPTGFEGPCGPTVEFYVDDIEVWNLVFNEYYFKNNCYTKLKYCGVDTGAGLERFLVVLNNHRDVYDTDLFKPLVDIAASKLDSPRNQRLVTDHIKATIFALADGIMPTNKEAGYVVRRLIRRSLIATNKNYTLLHQIAKKVIEIYDHQYPHLHNADLSILDSEIEKWRPIELAGEKHINRLKEKGVKRISGVEAFDLYQSHGFPIDLTNELALERHIAVDESGFWEEFEKHQKISRGGSRQKFKGGLGGHSSVEIRYHTAAHLLHRILQEVVGEHAFQRGVNITPERLRFDFAHPHPLSEAEIAQVEALVNQKISEKLPVTHKHMSLSEAMKTGAVGLFNNKYGDKVSVYAIGQWSEEHIPFSLEICGGPHVDNTFEIGQFKIIKEESVSAGTRRIRATIKD